MFHPGERQDFESHQGRRCVAALGCTPMAWVRQLHLARAQVSRQGGMAVADVARAVGDDSPSAPESR